MHEVTSQNYLQLYLNWCQRCSIPIARQTFIIEWFSSCETNQDFKIYLNALYDITIEGKLRYLDKIPNYSNFMTSKLSHNDLLVALNARLNIRLELFKRIPSATNMLLAYNLIEEIILKTFALGTREFNDKSIERFDKLKNLALGTKFIAERQLAFNRSVETFRKLIA